MPEPSRAQRCLWCGQVTAEFNRRLRRWICRCGWSDKRRASPPVPRKTTSENDKLEAWLRRGEGRK